MGNISQFVYNWAEINEDTKEVLYICVPSDLSATFYQGFDFSVNPVVKMGIKAPPGTRVEINGKIFTVGIGGTLNFNKPGYEIRTLKFLLEYDLKKDVEATKKILEQGLQEMDLAISKLLQSTKATILVDYYDSANNEINTIEVTTPQNSVMVAPGGVVTNTALELSGAQKVFINDYLLGYYKYSSGLTGVYVLNLNAQGLPIKKEIYNVLIDVEYKQ